MNQIKPNVFREDAKAGVSHGSSGWFAICLVVSCAALLVWYVNRDRQPLCPYCDLPMVADVEKRCLTTIMLRNGDTHETVRFLWACRDGHQVWANKDGRDVKFQLKNCEDAKNKGQRWQDEVETKEKR